MARQTRAALLWDQVKAFAALDVRAFVSGQIDPVQAGQDQIRDAGLALKSSVDQITTTGAAVKAHVDQLDVTIAGKATAVHTHARADVNGLPALLGSADARLTALETAVALIKQRVGLP